MENPSDTLYQLFLLGKSSRYTSPLINYGKILPIHIDTAQNHRYLGQPILSENVSSISARALLLVVPVWFLFFWKCEELDRPGLHCNSDVKKIIFVMAVLRSLLSSSCWFSVTSSDSSFIRTLVFRLFGGGRVICKLGDLSFKIQRTDTTEVSIVYGIIWPVLIYLMI